MGKRVAILAANAVLAFSAPLHAQTVAPAQTPWDSTGRLYIFGDSQSDSGSSGKRGNPAFYDGRPSNGPLWWEYAYPNKNLAIDPFLNGLVGSTSDGINFAIGGGGVAGLPAPSGTGILPGAKQQAARYVKLVSANTISAPTANDTFVIYTGGNDFNYAARTGTTPNVTQMLADLAESANNLTALGAKRFIIVANDNSRNTPAQTEYYAGLRTLTRNLTAKGATVLYANFSLPLADMLQNTALYGLKDPVGICPADGYTIQTCPSNYFLYDGLHFTTNVHNVFGAYVAAAQSGVNYAAGTYAQSLNAQYQIQRDIADVMSTNALDQQGDRFSIYGFTRYNSGHANAQGQGGRADYSGYTIGLGAYVPLGDNFSTGISGAIYDGDMRIDSLLGGSGKSKTFDIAANLVWRSSGKYAVAMGGAGQHKLDLTRSTSFSWRPTVQNDLSTDVVFVSLEAGTTVPLSGVTLTPFGRIDYTNFKLGKTQEVGKLLTAEVNATTLNSVQISGGLKAEISLSSQFKMALTGSVSKEMSGNADLVALFDGINYSRAHLDMGRGVEAKGALDLSGQILKSVSASLEVGGRTGKLASDGYVQVGLTVPF